MIDKSLPDTHKFSRPAWASFERKNVDEVKEDENFDLVSDLIKHVTTPILLGFGDLGFG